MTALRARFVLVCQQGLLCGLTVWLAVSSTGVGSLVLVAPDPATGPGRLAATPPGLSLVAAEPAAPTVTEVPLGGSPAGRRAAVTGASRLASGSAPANGYVTLGVTWDAPVTAPGARTAAVAAGKDLAVHARTRVGDVWSSWQPVPYDADHGPDPGSPEADGARAGTDPLVVGDVERVEVRAVAGDGALPDGMSLVLVDPGEPVRTVRQAPALDTARTGATPAGATPAGAELAAARVTPEPRIFSRAQWGADERLRDRGSLRYFEVHGGFVHHTVNANAYSREQVPSILRGIYAYHTQSLGWSDIGYNFLVDRFGRIWEGRAGGVARPVVGAHTLGYNDYAFAMSAIGNFDVARPAKRMLRAYGRLMAWKLALHGVDAGSRSQRIGDRRFAAVNGHRDAGSTACPGRYLYARLGRIRDLADGYQRSFGSRDRDTDLGGSRWPDLVVRDPRTQKVSVVRTGGQVRFERRRTLGRFGNGVRRVVASRDLTGDRRPDLVLRRADGRAEIRTLRNGRYRTSGRVTGRFAGLDQLTAVGDLNRDGRNDLVGRTRDDHRLVLVRGRDSGRFARNRRLAPRWGGYGLTAGVGDLSGDGRNDLVARSGSALWLFRGTATGRRLGERTRLAGDWSGFDVLGGTGDLTRDGRPDLLARTRGGTTWIYPGDGRGGLKHRVGPFSRADGLRGLGTPGQVTGSRSPDLVGATRSGRIVVLAHRGTANLSKRVSTGQRFADTDLMLSVGDWNRDGRGDLMTRRRSDGALLFRPGRAGTRFGAPVRAGRGWGRVGLVTAAGDVTGDGRPDLLGQPRGGSMRIYPGDGRSGFTRSYVAFSRLRADRHAGVGRWNRDGAPDSLVRRDDGSLWVYTGNGPGGLTRAVRVGSRASRYDWFGGVADADGDGRADLLARQRSSGDLWLLSGTRGGDLAKRRFVAGGFGRLDLAR